MIERKAEPELMYLPHEVDAYARADFSAVNRAFAERVVELLPIETIIDVADLGTGPGDIPIRLSHMRPNWRITAVDASAPMLDVARKAADISGLRSRVTFLLTDVKTLTLPSAAYDLIISNSLLHHVASPPDLWAQVARIGRPGTIVFFRDLFRPESAEQAAQLVQTHAGSESGMLKDEFLRSLLAAYSVDEVRAQLDFAGLKNFNVALSSDRHLDITGRL